MKFFLSLLLVTMTILVSAQKFVEPDKIKTFNIVVNYDTYTVKTQMLKDFKKINVHDDRSYLWCSANKIIETRAGYDGKLLHGYYKSFYFENNQLRESGKVHYGLKTGEWRFWYADGKLREVITYKKGKKNGTYKLYNDYGNLMAKGRFKNDLLHGKFYTYNNQGGIEAKKTYRHGAELIPKIRPQKIKKRDAEPAPKKEKKSKKAKDNAGEPPAKKKKKEKTAAPDSYRAEKQETGSAEVKKKKSPAQWLKDLFKKKEKKPVEPATKPVSSTT
jgi:hypothetical protein